ncbi:DUF899 domain-containing protein [Minwuia sp.]|uniref:DUF899 domain-containing protein n=1 Tax=Minwuia sp. TaxID=2493630 RepID=UPI003A948E77
MPEPVIASRDEWLAARKSLLAEEKAHLRRSDELAAKRRALPRVRVEKDYRFITNGGEKSLGDLFGGYSQLIVQHFMFGPDWEQGCPSCSLWADSYDGTVVHMNQRDTGFVAVSRAPLEKLNAYRERMGWRFEWVSSLGSDFNFDFGVSATEAQIKAGTASYNFSETSPHGEEMPGASVFAKDPEGSVFHTYSTYARGLDPLNGMYAYLDLLPKGRDEDDLPFSMSWVRRHDEYDN